MSWFTVNQAVGAVLIAAVLLGAAPARADDATLAGEWLTYRDRFVADDGRVRDTGNNDVSHTEGQGCTMLFAATFNDRDAFDRVWRWTRGTLQHRDNALFSWRWEPGGGKPVGDTNNATDGDMLIAWALERAASRWRAPDYRDAARRIVADIRKKLIVSLAGRLVLLPGADGFMRPDGGAVVNPSYYVYPALEAFPRLDGSPEWVRLRRDGLDWLAKARFGAWHLTPDWIAIDKKGAVSPAPHLPARFGFDAIRIPLYLVWGHAATGPRLAPMMKYWDAFADKPVPAWVDVTDGAVAPFAAPSGFYAVIDLARGRLQAEAPLLPRIADSDDYYSASLILLAGLAREDSGR